jgi:hypothetical protein
MRRHFNTSGRLPRDSISLTRRRKRVQGGTGKAKAIAGFSQLTSGVREYQIGQVCVLVVHQYVLIIMANIGKAHRCVALVILLVSSLALPPNRWRLIQPIIGANAWLALVPPTLMRGSGLHRFLTRPRQLLSDISHFLIPLPPNASPRLSKSSIQTLSGHSRE